MEIQTEMLKKWIEADYIPTNNRTSSMDPLMYGRNPDECFWIFRKRVGIKVGLRVQSHHQLNSQYRNGPVDKENWNPRSTLFDNKKISHRLA